MTTYAGFDVLPSGSWDCGAGVATGCSSERSGGCGCGGGGGCSCGGSCGCGGRCGEGGAGGAGGVASVDPAARTSLRLRDYDGKLMHRRAPLDRNGWWLPGAALAYWWNGHDRMYAPPGGGGEEGGTERFGSEPCPTHCDKLKSETETCCAQAGLHWDELDAMEHSITCLEMWATYSRQCLANVACPRMHCNYKWEKKSCCHPNCVAVCRALHEAYAEQPLDIAKVKAAYNSAGSCCYYNRPPSEHDKCVRSCRNSFEQQLISGVVTCSAGLLAGPFYYALCLALNQAATTASHAACLARCPSQDDNSPWRLWL
jgi:hypothetical protein